jgi:hypothetical protein
LLSLGYLLKISSGRNSEMARRLASVTPTPPQEEFTHTHESSLVPLQSIQELSPSTFSSPVALGDVQISPPIVNQVHSTTPVQETEVPCSRLVEEDVEIGSEDSVDVEEELARLFRQLTAEIDESGEISSGDEMSQFEINTSSNSESENDNESDRSTSKSEKVKNALAALPLFRSSDQEERFESFSSISGDDDGEEEEDDDTSEERGAIRVVIIPRGSRHH